MDLLDIIINALIALGSALIGTYLGAAFLTRKQESKMKKVRSIAIRAIDIIKLYGKSSGTYDKASPEFNAKLNTSEKRTIVVALHKLGIPIVSPDSGSFDVRNVQFAPSLIDKDLLEDMRLQISRGQCDHLFFEDPDKYFNESQRIYALRSLARRFVQDVMLSSTYCPDKNQIIYSDNWKDFSWGEMKSIAVFKEQVTTNMYYGLDGKPNPLKIKDLESEIDAGLWDIYLNWTYEAYTNLMTVTDLNNRMVQFSQSALGQNLGNQVEKDAN